MQENQPVKLIRSARIFSDFCTDMEILPSCTPIFLVDGRGRILHKKKLETSREDFESLYNLADISEKSFMLEKRRTVDAYAVRGRVGDGKNFIVVSKDRDGFSRCVVCSYSENNCIRLNDYIQKLCSYKDYIDSFSELAFSSLVRFPAKRVFRMKLSGALELVSLASDMQGREERRISFPVSLALSKLSSFAAKTNGKRAELTDRLSALGAVVSANESFFRLCVSVMALVFRHSLDGGLVVDAFENDENDGVRISFSAKSRITQNERDIYEEELKRALRAKGCGCGILKGGEKYEVYIDVQTEKQKELVLSDIASVSARLDRLISEEAMTDMYFAVSDI